MERNSKDIHTKLKKLFPVERFVAQDDSFVEFHHERGAFVPVHSHFGGLQLDNKFR